MQHGSILPLAQETKRQRKKNSQALCAGAHVCFPRGLKWQHVIPPSKISFAFILQIQPIPYDVELNSTLNGIGRIYHQTKMS